MSRGYFVRLKDRGAVIVGGPDRRAFLQSLITNDVNLLDTQNLVYACLLTAQGKFLYDFFITQQGDAIQLECEMGTRAQALAQKLSQFRLRSKISIQTIENIDVFQVLDSDLLDQTDPRHSDLGQRLYTPPNLPEAPFEVWERHRLALTVPDGQRDLQVEKSTLEEGRIDTMNGVSYTKGCYLGQELTARMHYRGLAKRHLYTIQSTDPNRRTLPAPGQEIKIGDTLIAEMRSSCGGLGLALIKDDDVIRLPESGYRVVTV